MQDQLILRFDAFGGPETLAVHRGLAVPEPGPGQVRVRVQASSVQFTDTLIRRGIYPDLKERPPLTPATTSWGWWTRWGRGGPAGPWGTGWRT